MGYTLPGMENSGTVPVNWLWVKAGLLSFWSRTTISIVVGFSSLSPLGDSAKAFSCTHKDAVKQDSCYYNPRHFISACFFFSFFCFLLDSKVGLRYLNTICARNCTGEKVQDVCFQVEADITVIWFETLQNVSHDAHKIPLEIDLWLFLRLSSFHRLQAETQNRALKKNTLWCLVLCIGRALISRACYK